MDAFSVKRQILELSTGKLSYGMSGAGPALMFLHGMNGSYRSWAKQFDCFATDYRVIAWDAPGYGLSDLVAPVADAYAAVALEMATALGVKEMAIIGHSMGGIVAARMATMAPERISGLVLSSSFVGRGLAPGTPLQERYSKRIDELATLPLAEYVSRRAKAVLPEHTAPEVVRFIEEVAAEMRIDGLKTAATMAQCTDNTALLSQIECPTLIFTTTLDRVLPNRFSLPFLESIRNVAHVTIEGVGHAAYVEADRVYNSALMTFFNALNRDSGFEG